MNRLIKHVLILTTSITVMIGTVIANIDNAVSINNAVFETSNELSDEDQTLENPSLVFVKDVFSPIEKNNITTSINGPNFREINNTWKDSFTFNLHNISENDIAITSKALYIEDPDSLRDDIFVALYKWDDKNRNNRFEDTELGEQLAYDSVLRWKNDHFELGNLKGKETKSFVLLFDGSGITQTNLNKRAEFSFKFYPVTE